MDFRFIIVTTLLCVYLLHTTGAQPDSSECASLDQAVQSIDQDALTTLGGSINCSRNTDCTGLSCMVIFGDEKTEIRVKLHPCDDPPQMYLLIQDPDTNLPYVEQTVTHGDSFPIPGLEISSMGFLTISAAVSVQFEKVPEGFEIGLSLVPYFGDTDLPGIPLMPPTVINTPPCSTRGPESLQCSLMQDLLDRVDPPQFECTRNADCRGFSCSGDVEILHYSYAVVATVVLDSCLEPVTYNMTLHNDNNQLLWSHTFIHSSAVFIEGDNVQLPPGVHVRMNVTMNPVTENIDYILTTLQLKVYCGEPLCATETFLNNDRVPIPPCDHPRPTSTRGPTVSLTPIPGATDECSTFQAIATDVMNNNFFARDDMQCHANGLDTGLCDGFTCIMTTNGNHYVYQVKLFHCESPVRLLFTLDDEDESHNYHVAQNITGQGTVQIDRVSPGLRIKIVVVQQTSDVELALTLQLPISGELHPIPLVEDRLVPVPPCPTTKPGPTDILTTVSPKVTKPGGNGGGGNKGKAVDPAPYQAVKIAIPVVVAVIVVIAVVVIVIWYRRRYRSPGDQMQLVSSPTESS